MEYTQYLSSSDEAIQQLEDIQQLAIYRGLIVAIRQLGRNDERAKQLIDETLPRRTEAPDIEEPQEEPTFLEEWHKMKKLYQDIKGLAPQDNQ